MDQSERLSSIEREAGSAWTWIEAHIQALEARDDMDSDRKAYWIDRWRKSQREFVEIGGRAYRDRRRP